MLQSDMDHLLPQDEELLHREKAFLELFNRYSIDEGDDPELYDFDQPIDDNVEVIEDDKVSGSSFSETSDIEADNDGDAAIKTLTKQLQPVVQQRVNSWPKKGFQLQLKTADPSVSVADWLKANEETTTTTKKYKKVVVKEDNKTTTTTVRQTKTTTKKSSFNSFVPQLIGLGEAGHLSAISDVSNEATIQPEISATSNHSMGSRESSKDKKKVTEKPTVQKKVATKLPELVDVSAINQAADGREEIFSKAKRLVKVQSKQRKNETKVDSKSKSEEKLAKFYVIPSNDGSGRCLRSRSNKNIVKQVRDVKTTANKQPVSRDRNSRPASADHSSDEPLESAKKAALRGNVRRQPKDAVSKDRNNKPVSETDSSHDLQLTAVALYEQPTKKPTESVHRSRSPRKVTQRRSVRRYPKDASSKDRNNKRASETDSSHDLQLTAVVPSEQPTEKPTESAQRSRLPRKETKRRNVHRQPKDELSKDRNNKQASETDSSHDHLQLTAVVPYEQPTESTHRSRSPLKERAVNQRANIHKLRNVRVIIKKMPPIAVVTTRRSARMQREALAGRANETTTHSQFVGNCEAAASLMKNEPRWRPKRYKPREIVIHSPNSDTILGTKIDETFMLVTRHDYEKRNINLRSIRRSDILNDSVLPIHRRIVYHPPAMDAINDTADWDSDCDDDLLTAYMTYGHIEQLRI